MDFKNLSPRQVAAVNALSISILVALANYIFISSWWIALITLVVLFIISYSLINFLLQEFIYRRIKLIYKFIYQTKASKKEETYYKYVLPKKSIDEVSEDVEKWAEQRKEEIE